MSNQVSLRVCEVCPSNARYFYLCSGGCCAADSFLRRIFEYTRTGMLCCKQRDRLTLLSPWVCNSLFLSYFVSAMNRHLKAHPITKTALWLCLRSEPHIAGLEPSHYWFNRFLANCYNSKNNIDGTSPCRPCMKFARTFESVASRYEDVVFLKVCMSFMSEISSFTWQGLKPLFPPGNGWQ